LRLRCGAGRRANPFVTLADNLALRQAVNDLQVRLESEQLRNRQLSREVRHNTRSAGVPMNGAVLTRSSELARPHLAPSRQRR